jgi:hypothetical protein
MYEKSAPGHTASDMMDCNECNEWSPFWYDDPGDGMFDAFQLLYDDLKKIDPFFNLDHL